MCDLSHWRLSSEAILWPEICFGFHLKMSLSRALYPLLGPRSSSNGARSVCQLREGLLVCLLIKFRCLYFGISISISFAHLRFRLKDSRATCAAGFFINQLVDFPPNWPPVALDTHAHGKCVKHGERTSRRDPAETRGARISFQVTELSSLRFKIRARGLTRERKRQITKSQVSWEQRKLSHARALP